MGGVILWLLVAIFTFAIDIITSTFFFVLFSIGAIVAAVCSAFNIPIIIQIIVFAIISIISVSIGYPWIKKNYKNMPKKTPLMEESYIGKEIIAEKDIGDKVQLKVGGIYWRVINEGETIHEGEKFKITGIDGIKLIIKKI